MKPQHLKYIQLAGEIAIPVLGYLFWSWSFYFLVLFYLLDFYAALGIFVLQDRKIRDYNNEGNSPFRSYLVLAVLAMIISVFAIFGSSHLYPSFSIVGETWKFLAYEEMGIPQGVLLVPLLVFAAYQNYKMNFLMTGKFRTWNSSDLWKKQFNMLLLILSASTLFISSTFLLILPEWVYVATLVGGSAIFRVFTR
jgi:hypothetical protein